MCYGAATGCFRNDYPRSYAALASANSGRLALVHSHATSIGSSAERPSAVSSYSTRGGFSACAVLARNPFRSIARSVSVSTLGVMTGEAPRIYPGGGVTCTRTRACRMRGGPGRGMPLPHGMVLAIEPMVISSGTDDHYTARDGWTIRTADGSRASHAEHTVAITDNGPRILTAP